MRMKRMHDRARQPAARSDAKAIVSAWVLSALLLIAIAVGSGFEPAGCVSPLPSGTRLVGAM